MGQSYTTSSTAAAVLGLTSSLLLLLLLAVVGPSKAGAFLVPTPSSSSSSYAHSYGGNTRNDLLGRLAVAGDGNPPPFGNWGSPPVAAPATYADAAPTLPPAPSPVVAATPTTTTTSTSSFTAAASSDDIVSDPIAFLQASQDEIVALIQAAIPDLAFKPAQSWVDEFGRPGSFLNAYDAPGASNVAWLANVHVPHTLSSLTIFNGPLTDVPHILSRCSCCDDDNKMLELVVDIRPRAYGAYECQDPTTGTYPGPEQWGRKAFEYAAARNEYITKFATATVQSWLDPSSFDRATPVQLPLRSELDQITGGPWALHVQMPATPSNVRRIADLRRAMVIEQWLLEWHNGPSSTQHQHRPGAPVNTQYVYDSKFRQNCYAALVPHYQRLMNSASDGAALAASESGPLDEGYVGGGS